MSDNEITDHVSEANNEEPSSEVMADAMHEAYGAMMYGGMRQKELDYKKPKSTEWKKNWVCFSPMYNEEEANDIVEYLGKEGVQQYWWTITGGYRKLIDVMKLDINKPQIFHGHQYVGSSMLEVQIYINTMKRIYE